jgi:hypothetical protein
MVRNRRTSERIEGWKQGDKLGRRLDSRLRKEHVTCSYCELEWGRFSKIDSAKDFEIDTSEKLAHFAAYRKVYKAQKGKGVLATAKMRSLDFCLKEADARREDKLTGRKLKFLDLLDTSPSKQLRESLDRAIDHCTTKKAIGSW